MKVRVRLFASFREASGLPEDQVMVAPGSTVGQLWERVIEAHPRLAPISGSAAFALNGSFTRPDAALHDGDEVAFLPPVSGG